MVKRAGTQDEVGVKGECGDPVSVVFQRVERLALKAQGLEPFSSREFESKTAPRSHPRCAPCDLTRQCIVRPCHPILHLPIAQRSHSQYDHPKYTPAGAWRSPTP
jgi:hypothetical protein